MAGLALVLLTIAVAILAANIIVALTSWRRGDAGKLAVSVLVTAVALLATWWLIR